MCDSIVLFDISSLEDLWLNPVAITVTIISSFKLGSITAPNIIFAPCPASSNMILVA